MQSFISGCILIAPYLYGWSSWYLIVAWIHFRCFHFTWPLLGPLQYLSVAFKGDNQKKETIHYTLKVTVIHWFKWNWAMPMGFCFRGVLEHLLGEHTPPPPLRPFAHPLQLVLSCWHIGLAPFLTLQSLGSVWPSDPHEGPATCSAKAVPSFLCYFKTLSNGPARGIEPSTSHSAVKCSTTWANHANTFGVAPFLTLHILGSVWPRIDDILPWLAWNKCFSSLEWIRYHL